MKQIITAIDTLRCHLEGADMRLRAEVHLSDASIVVRLGAALSYEFAVVDTGVRVVVRQVVDGVPQATVIATHATTNDV